MTQTPPMQQPLNSLAREAVARLIHENFVDEQRHQAIAPGIKCVETPDMTGIFTGSEVSWLNTVFLNGVGNSGIETAIDAALDRCPSRTMPMMWHIHPQLASSDLHEHMQRRGFQPQPDIPGMAADLTQLDEPEHADTGITITPVRNMASMETWCNVFCRDIFPMPSAAAAIWRHMYAAPGLTPQSACHYILAQRDNRVVGAAGLHCGAGVAAISCMGTHPDARRAGVATAMTNALLREARGRGYQIAVLYSTEMAQSMYRRAGFHEYCVRHSYEFGVA